MENDNFPIMSTLSLLLFNIRHALTKDIGDAITSSSSNQLTAQLLSGLLNFISKRFSESSLEKKRERQLNPYPTNVENRVSS
jgi:hypothetical protein